MQKHKKLLTLLSGGILALGLCAFLFWSGSSQSENTSTENKTAEMTAIEEALNLENMNAEWTYVRNQRHGYFQS